MDAAAAFFWGLPTILLILGTGLGITLYCGFPQLRLFRSALRAFARQLRGSGCEGSSYRALCTALAATVGTGNIAGVAGAIAIGGPGALFWMWVSAFLGMAVKFAESTLAVRFREGESSRWRGGMMYVIRAGLPAKWRFLGTLYCFFGLIAAFGVGNATQVNAVICALREAGAQYGFSLSDTSAVLAGIVLALVVAKLVSGGAGSIGGAAECLVPVAACAYTLVCLVSLWLNRDLLPKAVSAILTGAFSPEAVTGGAAAGFFRTLRTGVSRGLFTNEAGMGTAAMAHAGANVSHPVEQGLMGIMEVFLDTIVICTLTGLVILTSGVDIPYGTEAGAELTARALSVGLGPWVSAFVCACLCLFAVATILGWGLYAGRCAEYLLGRMNWKCFALCQAGCVLLGTLGRTELVWSLSELMNALMTLPNLMALLMLMPVLGHLTIDYARYMKCGPRTAGGTYENIHQRQPLPAFSHEKIPPLRRGSGKEGQKDLPSEHRSA